MRLARWRFDRLGWLVARRCHVVIAKAGSGHVVDGSAEQPDVPGSVVRPDASIVRSDAGAREMRWPRSPLPRALRRVPALLLAASLTLPGATTASDAISLHMDQSASPCRGWVVVDMLGDSRSDGRGAALVGAASGRIALDKIIEAYLTGFGEYERAIAASGWVDDRICLREARARELETLARLAGRGYGVLKTPETRDMTIFYLRHEKRALRGGESPEGGLYEAVYGIAERDHSEDWRYDLGFSDDELPLEELDRLEREARLAQADLDAADQLARGELAYILDPMSGQPRLESTEGLDRYYYYSLKRQQPEIRYHLDYGKPRKRVIVESTVEVLVPRLPILAAAEGLFATLDGFALVIGDTVLFQPSGTSDQPLEPWLPYLSSALAAPGCVSHTSVLAEPDQEYLSAFGEPPWSWVIHHEGETISATDGFGRYLWIATAAPADLPLPEACPSLPTNMRIDP